MGNPSGGGLLRRQMLDYPSDACDRLVNTDGVAFVGCFSLQGYLCGFGYSLQSDLSVYRLEAPSLRASK